jgi:hypothetical protein
MATDLRPMSLGEILDRTAQLYRENFLVFAGIFAFWSAVVLLVNLVVLGVQYLFPALALNGHHLKLTIAISAFEWTVSFLFIGAAIAAISRAVSWLHLGEPATIRGAYANTFPRIGRYLGLMTIAGIVAYAPIALLYAGLFGSLYRFGFFANPGQPPHLSTQDSIWLLSLVIGFFVLFIPAIAYTIIMTLRYSLALPASVLEGLKPRAAIRRSVQLSKGSRGRIFVLLLLIFCIKMGLIFLTQFFVFIAAFKHPGAQLSPGILAISQILGFFTNTFLGPISATGLTLFYYDQRIRKEGFDIEWMMQSAGMSAPALPAEDPIPATADEATLPVPPAEPDPQAHSAAELTAQQEVPALPEEHANE